MEWRLFYWVKERHLKLKKRAAKPAFFIC